MSSTAWRSCPRRAHYRVGGCAVQYRNRRPPHSVRRGRKQRRARPTPPLPDGTTRTFAMPIAFVSLLLKFSAFPPLATLGSVGSEGRVRSRRPFCSANRLQE